MRVMVIGATGAIGKPLVSQLHERGYEVIGTSRSASNSELLRKLGAQPIVLNALDTEAMRKALAETRPDAVIYQATALSNLSDFKHFDRSFAETNRLRKEGTANLIAAAHEAGVRRIVAQSFCGNMRYERTGGPVKTEDDPIDPNPPKGTHESFAAMAYLEKAVTDAGGIALRYGGFYGKPNDALVSAVRAGKFPIVGDGAGVWSFIRVDDAAAAAIAALGHDGAAIYNIVDDEPAPCRVWLPEVAKILGAKPPPHLPVFLARLLAGETIVVMETESRGASNAKAKRELGWTLKYPSWRQGFAAAYGQQAAMALQ
ncbi:MAG: NAD(P)-dependent oxidoreductase [Candidatus Cybelea sp.]